MKLPGKWKEDELLSIYASKGVDSDILLTIAGKYSCLEDFFEGKNLPTKLSKLFGKNELFFKKSSFELKTGTKQLEKAEEENSKIISFWDDEYPALLKEITNPPAFLFVRGSMQNSKSDSFSIVGTRRCTQYGKLTTDRFAEYFAKRGVIITSGLANGIDTQAHLSAVRAGGITYAVLGGGLDCLYPASAEKYVQKILDAGGAVITEYPFGTKPFQPYFLQRNRIISGISKAVLVVESAFKGGSLNTAAHAFDQGREVYAVPGKIDSDKSMGTNMLIKKNVASIAISPELVFKELALYGKGNIFYEEEKKYVNFDETEKKIYESIGREPLHIDDISEMSGFNMSLLHVKLLNLEFMGAVNQLPGKFYVRKD